MMKKLVVILSACLTIVACKKDIISEKKEIVNRDTINHWTNVWNNIDVDILSATFLNKDTGYFLTYVDSIHCQCLLTTYDGGKTWNNKIVNDKPNFRLFYDIYPFGNVFYIKYFKFNDSRICVQLIKSTDGGSNWSPVNFVSYDWHDWYPIDSLHIYVHLNNGVDTNCLFLSHDGGKTWQKLFSLEKDNYVVKIYFQSKSIGFILFMDAKNNHFYVNKTIDSGQTWFRLKCFFSMDIKNLVTDYIQFTSENTWYFLIMDTLLLKTIDEGIHWERVFRFKEIPTEYNFRFFDSRFNYTKGNIAGYLERMHFVNTDTGYYYDDNNVYMTSDGGITWNTDFTLTGKPLYAHIVGMSTVKTGEVYIITDCGTIFKRKL